LYTILRSYFIQGFLSEGKILQEILMSFFLLEPRNFSSKQMGRISVDLHGAFLGKIFRVRFKNFTKPHVRTKFKNKIG
jgi:hypothetical protein